MDEMQRLRARIDQIDQEIVLLLKSRNEDAKLLGRLKLIRGMPLRDPDREAVILESVTNLSRRLHVESKMLQGLFQQIFNMSVAAQDDIRDTQSSELDGLRLLVVGGTGRMGRFIAEFASLRGAKVKIAGRSIKKTERSADEMGVLAGTILDAAESDVVVVSVPIEDTERVAVETSSLMRAGSLLSEVSSVKLGVSDRIAARIGDEIEYVSIHPLFAPDIDQAYGQGLVMIPFRAGPRWRRLERAFRSSGMNVHKMSAAQHDQRMAHVQGLHHFALMTLGIELSDRRSEPRTRSLRDTETRISRMIENWETVRSIQTENRFVPQARRNFLQVAERLASMRGRDLDWARNRLVRNVQKWTRKQ